MTSIAPARTALILIAGLTLSACGEAATARGDGGLWEGLAEHVAAVPVTDVAQASAAGRSAAGAGLRPALEVEVMDVHDFWDARDGVAPPEPMRRVAEAAVVGAAKEAGHVAAEAVSQAAGGLHGRIAAPARTEPTSAVGRVVQLGAFSTEEAARRAWADVAARLGEGARALSPRFEPAEVAGKRLVRLKAGPVTPDQAPALCRAAGVEAAWCHARSTGAA